MTYEEERLLYFGALWPLTPDWFQRWPKQQQADEPGMRGDDNRPCCQLLHGLWRPVRLQRRNSKLVRG